MDRCASWLHPGGEIQAVRLTHIAAVIDDPGTFGETAVSLAREYDRFGEGMPHEGEARELIIARILGHGYIRIRERANHWIIQLSVLTPAAISSLCRWTNQARPTIADRYADVFINTLSDQKSVRTSFDRLESTMGEFAAPR